MTVYVMHRRMGSENVRGAIGRKRVSKYGVLCIPNNMDDPRLHQNNNIFIIVGGQ